MIRKIVTIDEDKCNGCGLCVPACAEGAIKIVNGKAVLDADNLCDGLGACLGECPQNAIQIIEREADPFDESAVAEHLQTIGRPASSHDHGQKPAAPAAAPHHPGGGCPGSRAMRVVPAAAAEPPGGTAAPQASQLRQWPVQLHLVPITAPYLQDADLLIAADCVPFAYANFHQDLLAGKVALVGCPKLDDNQAYLQKLTELFRTGNIRSITVARMEVPCCGGIAMAARQALAASGKDIPYQDVVIAIDGTRK
jgi:NAD-dependent dihydropyrimidine dehydrogenase PreA subunit